MRQVNKIYSIALITGIEQIAATVISSSLFSEMYNVFDKERDKFWKWPFKTRVLL